MITVEYIVSRCGASCRTFKHIVTFKDTESIAPVFSIVHLKNGDSWQEQGVYPWDSLAPIEREEILKLLKQTT